VLARGLDPALGGFLLDLVLGDPGRLVDETAAPMPGELTVTSDAS